MSLLPVDSSQLTVTLNLVADLCVAMILRINKVNFKRIPPTYLLKNEMEKHQERLWFVRNKAV